MATRIVSGQMTLLAWAMLLIAALPAKARAQAIKSYEVSGKTAAELIASMNARGPNGGWGYTKFHWSLSYLAAPALGGFAATRVQVQANAEMTLPSWPGYKSAGKCMQDSWSAMLRSLRNHEQRHVQLGAGVADRVRSAVAALPVQPSKAALDAAAKGAMQAIVDRNEAEQRQFDRTTDHGRKDPLDPIVLRSCQ